MQLQCWRKKEDQCRDRKIWRVFGQNLVNKHQPTTAPLSGTLFFSGKYCWRPVRRDRLPGLERGTKHNDTLHSENCDQGTQVLSSWDQLCHSRVISIASNSWSLSWKPAVNSKGREPHIFSILGSSKKVTCGLMKSIKTLRKKILTSDDPMQCTICNGGDVWNTRLTMPPIQLHLCICDGWKYRNTRLTMLPIRWLCCSQGGRVPFQGEH